MMEIERDPVFKLSDIHDLTKDQVRCAAPTSPNGLSL